MTMFVLGFAACGACLAFYALGSALNDILEELDERPNS